MSSFPNRFDLDEDYLFGQPSLAACILASIFLSDTHNQNFVVSHYAFAERRANMRQSTGFASHINHDKEKGYLGYDRVSMACRERSSTFVNNYG